MAKPQLMPKLLLVSEVAEILCCTSRHVRDLISGGHIAVIRTGEGVRGDRIEEDELTRFIRRRKTNRSIFEAQKCQSTSAAPSIGRNLDSTAELLDNLLGKPRKRRPKNSSGISARSSKRTPKPSDSSVH